MKRILDILLSFLGLLLATPILLPVLLAVWYQDFHSPFYIALRVGRKGKIFKMIKVRSMIIRAEQTGVDSTAVNDPRITPVGHFVRRFKIDEITQLWNVFVGEMSLVGPRPNVQREVALYTELEKKLLDVNPGMTDLSSIVFSDEGDILNGHPDPDLGYNQLIRPWKSRLGLLYVQHSNSWLDIKLIILTMIAMISKRIALRGVEQILSQFGADKKLIQVAHREDDLKPYPPPGSAEVVTVR